MVTPETTPRDIAVNPNTVTRTIIEFGIGPAEVLRSFFTTRSQESNTWGARITVCWTFSRVNSLEESRWGRAVVNKLHIAFLQWETRLM